MQGAQIVAGKNINMGERELKFIIGKLKIVKISQP